MKAIVDRPAPVLIKHLSEEFDVVLELEKTCDSDGLRKVLAEAENVAKATGKLSLLVNLSLPSYQFSPLHPSVLAWLVTCPLLSYSMMCPRSF
jgi:hypothetical protein